MPPQNIQPAVIFFDAVGTLIHLPKGVGYHYALVGAGIGLDLDPDSLDRAFLESWREMPPRPATGLLREDDDKGWWRELVGRVLDRTRTETTALDRDAYFEVVYEHFAEAGVWELYPEVVETLERLRARHRLAVISNFDGRLRAILEQLGVSKYFESLVISSEVGADKPDALIFRRALELNRVAAPEALHVGDDPVRDWEGAAAAGIRVVRLQRPRDSLRSVLAACADT